MEKQTAEYSSTFEQLFYYGYSKKFTGQQKCKYIRNLLNKTTGCNSNEIDK